MKLWVEWHFYGGSIQKVQSVLVFPSRFLMWFVLVQVLKPSRELIFACERFWLLSSLKFLLLVRKLIKILIVLSEVHFIILSWFFKVNLRHLFNLDLPDRFLLIFAYFVAADLLNEGFKRPLSSGRLCDFTHL
jgi:hypothetical protein